MKKTLVGFLLAMFAVTSVQAGVIAQDPLFISAQADPRVAAYADDSFVVVWDDLRNGQDSDIYAQRFDQDGSRLGPEIAIAVAAHRVELHRALRHGHRFFVAATAPSDHGQRDVDGRQAAVDRERFFAVVHGLLLSGALPASGCCDWTILGRATGQR